MPKNKTDHPADYLLESSLVENILRYADDPGACARYITAQIRELIGVRLVALVSAEAESGHSLLSLCPPRKEADWRRPEIQEFVRSVREFPGPRLVDHLTDPAGQSLSAIGIGTSFVIPLMVGADRVGMLILLGLPDMQGAENILATLTRVARILGLALKNSFLYRDLEHTVAARTAELETTLKRLQAELEECKRTAEALETERERLEVILAALNTGLSLINPDMTIAWVNHKIREMFPGREPVGQVCHVFYESRATICGGCGTIRAFMDGKVCESEQLVPATGRTYSIISQPIKDQAGRVVNVLEGITDISERLRAEEELRRSAREWSAAMDASEDVIYLLDLDRRVLRANKAFYLMTRSTPESAVGRPIAELLHPGGVTAPCPHCQAQKEQREVVFTLEPDHPHNPAGHPFEIALRMVRDDAGRPISMLKSWHDLTHERKVQAELTAYREHLEELVRVRTAEIEKKKREVERLNKLFVGRELRMIELKEQIQKLEARLAAERH